jgi:hypothetical protein
MCSCRVEGAQQDFSSGQGHRPIAVTLILLQRQVFSIHFWYSSRYSIGSMCTICTRISIASTWSSARRDLAGLDALTVLRVL